MASIETYLCFKSSNPYFPNVNGQVGPGGKSTRLQGFSSSREGKNAFVLKLDLKGGGRCRPKALANYFVRIA